MCEWLSLRPIPAASRHVCMMLCLMHGPLWFSSVLTSKCNCSKATTWPHAQSHTINGQGFHHLTAAYVYIVMIRHGTSMKIYDYLRVYLMHCIVAELFMWILITCRSSLQEVSLRSKLSPCWCVGRSQGPPKFAPVTEKLHFDIIQWLMHFMRLGRGYSIVGYTIRDCSKGNIICQAARPAINCICIPNRCARRKFREPRSGPPL